MTEMLYDKVAWDLQDGVARLTLSDPTRRNALGIAMSRAVHEAAVRVHQGASDGTVRVAVVAAEGAVFSVGGDLREFAHADEPGERVSAAAREVHAAILRLVNAPVPVVSVVRGAVAGGGLGLALAADLVIMAEETTIRLAYTAAGLSPDCGLTWVLCRRVGAARALDLALTNRSVTGGEAASWGLASRAVPDREVTEVADGIIACLRAGPREAYAETKRLMAAGLGRGLAATLDDESATISRLVTADDGAEGLDAFLRKRTPRFR